MRGLADRHVLVSGAASGIGEATVARLVAAGARVALVDRDRARLERTTAALAAGAQVAAFAADVGDETAVAAAVAAAVERAGPLGGVVTCAGIFDPGDGLPAADVALAIFERTLRV